MRKWELLIGLSVIIVAATLATVYPAFKRFLETPLIKADANAVTYILKPGSSVQVLARELNQIGILQHPGFLVILAYAKGVTTQLKAGEYLLKPNTKPLELLEQIAAGKVIYHSFTIVEGWTIKQILSALQQQPLLNHALYGLTPTQIAIKLKSSYANLEGLLYPATYYFTLGTRDSVLLEKAYLMMQIKLNLAWQKREQNSPFKTPYDALIAASLVEKETGVAAERPRVAGVIIKRLTLGMPLQIDSTVIYGLGSAYSGKLTKADLQQDTPFNTYTRKGLPPAPIGMPSEQSIQAVLHPMVNDDLYFVAKGDGTHYFSADLKAHNQAVKTYQLTMELPKIGKRGDKLRCVQLWYVPNKLHELMNVPCQVINLIK